MAAIPGRDDFNEFLGLFKPETDRAAVVLGGAYLDACLEEMLRTWLADDVDEHFESPNGLLSSYGAKYQLAHALGAIDATSRTELKHISGIRNHFAHHVVEAKWEHPKVQKHLQALRVSFAAFGDFSSDREVFLIGVAVLSGHLRRSERKVLEKAKSEALVPER